MKIHVIYSRKLIFEKALISSVVAYNPNYINLLLNLQKMNGFKKATRLKKSYSIILQKWCRYKVNCNY